LRKFGSVIALLNLHNAQNLRNNAAACGDSCGGCPGRGPRAWICFDERVAEGAKDLRAGDEIVVLTRGWRMPEKRAYVI